MADKGIADLLRRLGSRESQRAWTEFLELYSPLVLQVTHLFEHDPEHIANCFLFVCEQLSRNGFRRLRRFHVHGPASFPTWLRAVVRNLCLDWRRQEFGRQRIFHSVEQLSRLDQEVFRCIHLQGLSAEDAFLTLHPRIPDLRAEQVSESLERLHHALTPRQRWLLSVRTLRPEPIGDGFTEPSGGLQVADPAPGPEDAAALRETRDALARALAGLPAAERLLIRLRFEQELTLEQVGHLSGLGSAQSADRRLREILERLRRELE